MTTDRAQLRATLAEIHGSAVDAVAENYASPFDAGDGWMGEFFRRHNEAMARVATSSGLALLELDGPSTLQVGYAPRRKAGV